MDDKRLLEILRDDLVEHDPHRCGACMYRMIKARVAEQMLEAHHYEYAEAVKIAKDEFKRTTVYNEVQALRKQGKTFEEAREIMQKRGWIDI